MPAALTALNDFTLFIGVAFDRFIIITLHNAGILASVAALSALATITS